MQPMRIKATSTRVIPRFGRTESGVTHDLPDWPHRVDRFTLTRNRNYRCPWKRIGGGVRAARFASATARERELASAVFRSLSPSPWNALAREVGCLCFHREIVYPDIITLSRADTFSTVALGDSNIVLPGRAIAVTKRNRA